MMMYVYITITRKMRCWMLLNGVKRTCALGYRSRLMRFVPHRILRNRNHQPNRSGSVFALRDNFDAPNVT